MSFDGSFTHAMVKELTQLLKNGRVSKINQPYANDLIITIRNNHQNYPLILSANPSYARAQITQIPYTNPKVPSNFNMTLRKHLNGSVLEDVEQVDNDRIMHFRFMTRNEIGDLKPMLLIVEIMARHSNIILVDPADMQIVDSIKRVNSAHNRYRTILPGSKYIGPPKQDSIDPFRFDNFKDLKELTIKYPNQDVLATNLQKTFQGLGKDTALALAITLHQNGDIKTLFQRFFDHFNQPKPTLIVNDQNKTSYTVYPFQQFKDNQSFNSLSELLDYYYKDKTERDRINEQGAVLIQTAKNEVKKNRNKQKKLKKTFKNSQYAEEYKIKGEVLTTYMNQVQTGMGHVELPDFYNQGKKIGIDLSYDRTPSENAQWYFKQYRKKQNAGIHVKEQMEVSKTEMDYFQNILSQIELAQSSDLNDIKLELQQEGYLKKHQNNRSKRKTNNHVNKPERFMTDDGTLILVGKNNLQNDRLTFRNADKREIWMHTKNIHGSHVIIKNFDPSDETIEQAAKLAAYFSKGRESSNVPVDYVDVKHVNKPNGGKPGFVTYEGQTTVFVTPSEQDIDHFKQNFEENKN